MTAPFNADDLIKRSLLGSIIGYARKKPKCSFEQNGQSTSSAQGPVRDAYSTHQSTSVRSAGGVAYEIAEKAAQVASTHGVDTHLLEYRTQQDIYDEIVCECARLEGTNSVTSSRSASQSPSLVTSGDDHAKPGVALGSVAFSPQQIPSASCPTEPLATVDPRINCSDKNITCVSIEEFVRLVVTAVQESGLVVHERDGAETPEEILRRKRAQNNEAAARYRRRQKELRQEAEVELQVLMSRNKELKEQVERMQIEILRLRTAVLHSQTDSDPQRDLDPGIQHCL